MSDNIEITARINLLTMMNAYIFNVLGDDDVTDYWLTYGVLDGASLQDFKEIAEDTESFNDTVGAFARCCKMADN